MREKEEPFMELKVLMKTALSYNNTRGSLSKNLISTLNYKSK